MAWLAWPCVVWLSALRRPVVNACPVAVFSLFIVFFAVFHTVVACGSFWFVLPFGYGRAGCLADLLFVCLRSGNKSTNVLWMFVLWGAICWVDHERLVRVLIRTVPPPLS